MEVEKKREKRAKVSEGAKGRVQEGEGKKAPN